MEHGEFWKLGHVSDARLRSELTTLVVHGCRTEARIVAHLAEAERRKLYLKDGYSSLYKYCLRGLGLSESQAYQRMTAASIGVRFPMVFAMIERRTIHLSGLVELRNFLDEANHRELLEQATGKTRQQISELLAARFPGRIEPDSVRRLRGRRVRPVFSAPSRSETSTAPSVRSETNATPPGTPTQGERAAPAEAQPAALPELFDPVTGEVRVAAEIRYPGPLSSAAEVEHGSTEPTSTMNSNDRSEVERGGGYGRNLALDSVEDTERSTRPAIADARYRIQFDASSTVKAKLELARALSSHSNPRGELEILFERALDAYLEQLEKRRFGKSTRTRSKEQSDASRLGEGLDAPLQDASQRIEGTLAATSTDGSESSEAVPSRQRGQHEPERGRRRDRGRRKRIPNATRRAVTERDGERCCFVGGDGQRCDERGFLQFDHRREWARNGDAGTENLRLLCAFHNRWLAEQTFGAEHVERCIERGRTRDES